MVPMGKDMCCRLFFSSSFDRMLPAAESEHVDRLIRTQKRGRWDFFLQSSLWSVPCPPLIYSPFRRMIWEVTDGSLHMFCVPLVPI